ncbi:unnamed protein product, partial [Rotaria sp. Silwood1]
MINSFGFIMIETFFFYKDSEQGEDQWRDFTGLESKEIRRGFIRKVYSILMIQLVITFGLIAIFHFILSIHDYVRSSNGPWLYWISYIVFLVIYCVLICSQRAARRFPLNLILLDILMGMISAYYKIESVLIAVGITVFVCLGITLFSFQTKYDFTSCFGVLLVISLIFLAFGIVCIFTYSRFLAVDTRLLIGGKQHEISAEDHVFASLMLYIDVLYIFIYIL